LRWLVLLLQYCLSCCCRCFWADSRAPPLIAATRELALALGLASEVDLIRLTDNASAQCRLVDSRGGDAPTPKCKHSVSVLRQLRIARLACEPHLAMR
jgi:hypothetical protein